MSLFFGSNPHGSQYTIDANHNFLHVGNGNGLGSAGFVANQLVRGKGFDGSATLVGTSSSAQVESWQMYKGAPCVDLATGASGAPLCKWIYPLQPLLVRPVGTFQHGTGFDVVSYRAVLAWAVTDKRAWFDFRLATNPSQVPIVLDGAQAGFGLKCVWVSQAPAHAEVHFVSRRNDNDAQYAEDSVLPWPVALSEWAHVEWRFTSARVNADAKAELFVNGARLLARSWGAGTVLPDYSGKANGACFNAFFEAESASQVNHMYVRHARYIAAPFNAPMEP